MKCFHCPFQQGECPGETAQRICELVDPEGGAYDPEYVRTLGGRPLDWKTVEDPLFQLLLILDAARICPHKEVDCGCRYGKCSKYRREVTPRFCETCIRKGNDL